MTALGMALVSTTTTETRIAAGYRDSAEATDAAEAGVARAMQDLATVSDWNIVLAGGTTSAFVDGPPGGSRALPGGSTLNLTTETNTINCGKTAACGDADMDENAAGRPWRFNNPRWMPYAYGALDRLLSTGTIRSRMYVVVWVADDPAETDCSPLHDGGPANLAAPCHAVADGNPGAGTLAMLARAYGPDGVRRAVEVTVARGGASPSLRILSWRDVRDVDDN